MATSNIGNLNQDLARYAVMDLDLSMLKPTPKSAIRSAVSAFSPYHTRFCGAPRWTWIQLFPTDRDRGRGGSLHAVTAREAAVAQVMNCYYS